jgi:hypothetical protein
VIGSANDYALPADALWQAGKNFAALQRGEARRQGMIPTRRRALSRKNGYPHSEKIVLNQKPRA